MGLLTRLPGGDLVRDADRANRTMKKHTADDWMGALFGIVAVLPSICSIGTGAGVIIVAGVGWLKTAVGMLRPFGMGWYGHSHGR
jgi:hypothetical protein